MKMSIESCVHLLGFTHSHFSLLDPSVSIVKPRFNGLIMYSGSYHPVIVINIVIVNMTITSTIAVTITALILLILLLSSFFY